MSYSERDARLQLLAELGQSAARIDAALAALGDAYEWLDEQSADRLEAELFRPVSAAAGRARRSLTSFARRVGLEPEAPASASPTGRPGDARGSIERAADALSAADAGLASLQDSLLPVEVGDRELREDLAAIREAIAAGPARARDLVRVLGR